jgi:adenosylhomocysteinase
LIKDGAILANAGHFNVEIDVQWLEINADRIERRDGIDTYILGNRSLHVLAQGRLVNLAIPKGMGHPIEVMDLSFALQALCAEYILTTGRSLEPGVYDVPSMIDDRVARMKLASLGITLDSMTDEQQKYLKSWDIGT